MKNVILITCLFIVNLSFAQVGINTTSPEPSSILDVVSADKGMLVPRVSLSSTTDGTTVNAPAEGLLVYNTATVSDIKPGFYYWNGTKWNRMATLADGSTSWKTDGNTVDGSQFLGTLNDEPLNFRTNNKQRLSLTQKGQLEFFGDGKSIFIGEGAGEKDNQGTNNHNVFIGHAAGTENVSGSANSALGYNALFSSSSSVNNTALGYRALKDFTGSLFSGNNTVVGANAGRNILNGGKNTFVGSSVNLNGGDTDGATVLGYLASSEADNTIVLGSQAKASGDGAAALGTSSVASQRLAIALGSSSAAQGEKSIAIGYNTKSTSGEAVAIGNYTLATGLRAVAIGGQYSDNTGKTPANATQADAIAIGTGATASGINAIAMGTKTQAAASNATAIGSNTTAPNANTVILGNNANVGIGTNDPQAKLHVTNSFRYVDGNQGAGKVLVSDADGSATWGSAGSADAWSMSGNTITDADFLGSLNDIPLKIRINNFERFSFTNNGQLLFTDGGIKIGVNSYASNKQGIGIGENANGYGDNAISIGNAAVVNQDAVGLGKKANAYGIGSISIGSDTYAAANGVALGNAAVVHEDAIALGKSALADGNSSVSIGSDTYAAANGVALGKNAKSNSEKSIAIGNGASASAINAIAIGSGTLAPNGNTLILGKDVNVGIGTSDPQAKLQVEGGFKLVDGTQGINKVLTSDANGKASWKTFSGGSPSSKEYGEIYFANDQELQLLEYTNKSFPPNASPGLSSANVGLSLNGITPQISGVFKVTFTINYQITSDLNNAIKNIEFYLTENENKIPNSSSFTAITDSNRHSITIVKILELISDQTYYVGVASTGSAAGGPVPKIRIIGGSTNVTIASF